jgi:hypothetical protein
MTRRTTKLTMAGCALLLGILAPLGGALAPAAAADEYVNALAISFDGVSFSESPEGSLFPADVALVPGSSVSTTVFLRNESDRAGEFQLAISGATASQASFLESLSMRASTAANPTGAAVPLTAGDQCSPLLAGEALPAGATAAVTITLLMDESVGNAEQRSTAGTDLHVSLREPGSPDLAGCEPGTGIPVLPEPTDPVDPVDAEDPDTVPATGLPVTGLAIGFSPWIGVSALVAGTVIFLISRHRKRLEAE